MTTAWASPKIGYWIPKIKGMLEVERYPRGVLKMFSWPIKWYIKCRLNGIVKFYALKVYSKYTKGIFKAN